MYETLDWARLFETSFVFGIIFKVYWWYTEYTPWKDNLVVATPCNSHALIGLYRPSIALGSCSSTVFSLQRALRCQIFLGGRPQRFGFWPLWCRHLTSHSSRKHQMCNGSRTVGHRLNSPYVVLEVYAARASHTVEDFKGWCCKMKGSVPCIPIGAHHTAVDIQTRQHLWKGLIGMERTKSFRTI